MPDGSSKICVICGADCAGKPRVKDPKGHYYCKPCHESALQRRRSAAAADTPPVPQPIPVEEDAEDGGFEVLSEVLDRGGGAAVACPGCGMDVADGTVLCTNCGHDFRTGEQLGTAAPPTLAGGPREGAGRSAWPMVVGVISCVLGGAGAALYALQLVAATVPMLSAGSSDPTDTARAAGFMVGAVVANGLVLLLSLWLLTAGIGIIRRRQRAIASIRRWAIVKIALYSCCLGCVLAMAIAGSAAAAPLSEQTGDMGMGVAIAIMAALLGWFLAWPVFVLTWTGRDAITAEVGNWGQA